MPCTTPGGAAVVPRREEPSFGGAGTHVAHLLVAGPLVAAVHVWDVGASGHACDPPAACAQTAGHAAVAPIPGLPIGYVVAGRPLANLRERWDEDVGAMRHGTCLKSNKRYFERDWKVTWMNLYPVWCWREFFFQISLVQYIEKIPEKKVFRNSVKKNILSFYFSKIIFFHVDE